MFNALDVISPGSEQLEEEGNALYKLLHKDYFI